MSQFLLLLLILTDAFLLNVASFPNPPYPSPSSEGNTGTAEPPAMRKFGKHRTGAVESYVAPCSSPSQEPGSEDVNSEKEVSASDQEIQFMPGQQVQTGKRHHSIDRSVAGGGVILGGLATVFLVAVFRYIRATGRKNAEPDA